MKPFPSAVAEFVSAAHVCRIATVRHSGEPHVIPVCPAFDGEATLYVDIARAGITARGVAANPNVTVLIDEYDDDWSKLRAVILRCVPEVLSGSELDAAWELFLATYPQGESVGWSARLTLALRINDWTEWGITRPLPYQPE